MPPQTQEYPKDDSDLPSITTAVLQSHVDEVWDLQWSHNGAYLATCGKDKTTVIWEAGYSAGNGDTIQEWSTFHILRDHPYHVGHLAWSPDDSILLTSAEHLIKMWNVQNGVCIKTLAEHAETVTALTWLSDGSGFISGSLDGRIIHWTANGDLHKPWEKGSCRIVDLTITPDCTRLVAIGFEFIPQPQGNDTMMVHNLTTNQTERTITLEGYALSVTSSQDSGYVLVNVGPKVYLWNLHVGRVACEYTGSKQSRHIIGSCFGGKGDKYVVSGSEDGKVYVWDRETGVLLKELIGHGEGTVNSVAWHPRCEWVFASCSDDNTVRIWEAPMTLEDAA